MNIVPSGRTTEQYAEEESWGKKKLESSNITAQDEGEKGLCLMNI